MESRWSDAEAQKAIDRYAARSGEPLALRVYTSRLIGSDADLVLHGGGNTSVKIVKRNLLGDEVEALCVKGSGWDLDSIEPPGFPALDLAWLRRLRKLDALSDEEMVNQFRTHLFDASAPNPSVETLLHAFLPHPFIDHTHADAILALTNQPDGAALVREALGDDVIVVPYVMPGFRLAKLAAEMFRGAYPLLFLHDVSRRRDCHRPSDRYGAALRTTAIPAARRILGDAAAPGDRDRDAMLRSREEGVGGRSRSCRHHAGPGPLAGPLHPANAALPSGTAISQVVVPLDDGGRGVTSVFDIPGDPPLKAAAALHRKSLRRLGGGVVWLRVSGHLERCLVRSERPPCRHRTARQVLSGL
jgi:hypothetical protein